MGCDIHTFVEVKINDKWYLYNQPYINRNYALFTKIANVRSYDDEITPIDKPRGLPDDLSEATKFCAEHYIDGHSHTYLTSKEAGEVQTWYEVQFPGNHHPPVFGYLFGNDIDSYIRYPQDGKSLFALGYQDARVIIWFDN